MSCTRVFVVKLISLFSKKVLQKTHQMIRDIDKSEVLGPNIIDSPVLGGIGPERLSDGVQALILMAFDNLPTTIVEGVVTSFVQVRVENGVIYPPLEVEESGEE